MKIILNEKIRKLGNIGDTVDVATGFARNYLLPNGKAIRWSRENIAIFESQRAGLVAKQEAAKKSAESQVDAVRGTKFYMIRQAGDTGHLYGSVSSRDIARLLAETSSVKIDSSAVLLGNPIKMIGTFDTQIMLHADVVVPVKIYVAQTMEEIEALVAGKVLTFGTKKAVEEDGEGAGEGAGEGVGEGVGANNHSPENEKTGEKPATKSTRHPSSQGDADIAAPVKSKEKSETKSKSKTGSKEKSETESKSGTRVEKSADESVAEPAAEKKPRGRPKKTAE